MAIQADWMSDKEWKLFNRVFELTTQSLGMGSSPSTVAVKFQPSLEGSIGGGGGMTHPIPMPVNPAANEYIYVVYLNKSPLNLFIETWIHELVHVGQFYRGWLKHNADDVSWRGIAIPLDRLNENQKVLEEMMGDRGVRTREQLAHYKFYKNLPWEVDANETVLHIMKGVAMQLSEEEVMMIDQAFLETEAKVGVEPLRQTTWPKARKIDRRNLSDYGKNWPRAVDHPFYGRGVSR